MGKGTRTAYTLLIIAILSLCFYACGQSYEESKRLSREERARLQREDSLAFKVGVMPTLDCLPMFVAKDCALFDSAMDIRLKFFKVQMDCDEALRKSRIEGSVTDIVRALRLSKQGVDLDFTSSTNAYWQLVSNRKSRIKQLKQMSDKMIAMTRYSATALLSDFAVDSAKLKSEEVFRIQINDVNLRLKMLLNNELDAALLPEPQATAARLYKNPVLMDTRDKDWRFGLIAFRQEALKDKRRMRQMEAFTKGYNAACDSINKHGLKKYASVIEKYYSADSKTIAALPQLRFNHMEKPRQKDIARAEKWIKK